MSVNSSPVIAVPWSSPPDYKNALDLSGADVRFLAHDLDLPSVALDGCHGLLLTGGADIDPRLYGERQLNPQVELAPERDSYEFAITREAIRRDMPLFAVCRGMQVLNVVGGGSLVQDIPSEIGSGTQHMVREPRDAIAHVVALEANTRLSELLAKQLGGRSTMEVNSRHHQSVREPAQNFIISATAPDGVIEAIESHDALFCLGVQWHPENFWRDGRFASLFAGFIEAARRYGRGARLS